MQRPTAVLHEPLQPRRRNRWRKTQRALWSYVFLTPWLILLGLFVIYPQVASYPYTLYNWDGIGEPSGFVGLDNFRAVLVDPFFWRALRNTVVYTALLVPVQLLIALALALILNNPRLKAANFYRTLFFSPAVTSAAVVGIVISFLLNQLGPQITEVLRALKLVGPYDQVTVLANPNFALYAIIIVGIWKSLGINVVYFLAALQTIPPEVYEAGRIDGASPMQEFRHITIPMLRQPGLVIVFLAIIGSLHVFDLALVLVGSGPGALLADAEVIGTYVYRNSFGGGNNVGLATAAALIMGLITILLGGLQMFVYRRAGIRSARRIEERA